MNPRDIIIRPVITERSLEFVRVEEGKQRKYTFEVANVNKIEIAKAFEACFEGTKVVKVNTVSVRGKYRRQGKYEGYTPSWKKAIITVTADSKSIEIFEGML
jgi:large subunit ribosomal protein L23